MLGSSIWLAFDDRFVGLHTTLNIIRFDGQHFLQGIGRAVGFQRPDFHFTEALTTELRFTAQRLLRDQAVRAGRTSMHLVFNQVVQLQHRHHTHGHRLVIRIAGLAIAQGLLSQSGYRNARLRG